MTLEVTGNNETDTENKQGYITVLGFPGQDGSPSVCTGQSYFYGINPILYAQGYEWELSPADVGTLNVDDTSAYLEVAENWNGNFTLRARANNLCGDGDCSNCLEGNCFC